MNDMLLLLLGRIFPGIIGSSLIGANILKLAAIIGTMSISFFGMRLWVFFHHKLAGEVQSLADYETESLPAITLVYDANTIIAGTIKPSHNADTTVIREDDKPNLSMFASNTTGKSWQDSLTLVIESELPVTPLPMSNNEQIQVRNLRHVKLMPLCEMESPFES